MSSDDPSQDGDDFVRSINELIARRLAERPPSERELADSVTAYHALAEVLDPSHKSELDATRARVRLALQRFLGEKR